MASAAPGTGAACRSRSSTPGSTARQTLVDFVHFRAWGTSLTPARGGAQFEGYATEPRALILARAKYAGMPELLAAIAANEAAWSERLDLDDDDDDDDD